MMSSILTPGFAVETAKQISCFRRLFSSRESLRNLSIRRARQLTILLSGGGIVRIKASPIQIAVIDREKQADLRIPSILWITRQKLLLALRGGHERGRVTRFGLIKRVRQQRKPRVRRMGSCGRAPDVLAERRSIVEEFLPHAVVRDCDAELFRTAQ